MTTALKSEAPGQRYCRTPNRTVNGAVPPGPPPLSHQRQQGFNGYSRRPHGSDDSTPPANRGSRTRRGNRTANAAAARCASSARPAPASLPHAQRFALLGEADRSGNWCAWRRDEASALPSKSWPTQPCAPEGASARPRTGSRSSRRDAPGGAPWLLPSAASGVGGSLDGVPTLVSGAFGSGGTRSGDGDLRRARATALAAPDPTAPTAPPATATDAANAIRTRRRPRGPATSAPPAGSRAGKRGVAPPALIARARASTRARKIRRRLPLDLPRRDDASSVGPRSEPWRFIAAAPPSASAERPRPAPCVPCRASDRRRTS